MPQTPNDTEQPIYIRRCHVCSAINESAISKLEACQSCGKFLAPFLFCNDVGADLAEVTPKIELKGTFLRSEYPPIYGISLYW